MSETNNGKVDIRVSPKVIAQYVGQEAKSCFGIVGMAAISVKDGLVKLLRRENTDDLRHGISVRIEDNAIHLSFHIIAAYGVSVLTIYENLVDTVKYKVEQFTGMKVARIDLYTEGVRVID